MKAIVALACLLFSPHVSARAWSPASASADCTAYTVLAGDTCWNIMRTTGATFAQILSWNPTIDKQCTNLNELEGQDICISNPNGDYAIPSNTQGLPTIITTTAPIPSPTPNDTEDRCAEFHLVEAGEDCSHFSVKYGITKKDFLFLNPHVWENCTNVYLDYYYCVRPVGYISTYPGYLPTTSTKEFIKTPTTQVPYWPNAFAEYDFVPPVIPRANQTRKDCYDYFHLLSAAEYPDLTDCWSLAILFDITPEEFVLWNPSLSQGDEGGSDDTYPPCTISESLSYCVALESPTPAPPKPSSVPPSPRAAGEIDGCTRWYRLREGRRPPTCETVLLTNGLSFNTFFHMNPSVKDDCTGLTLGTFYCVSTAEGGELDISLPPASTTSTASTTSSSSGVSTPTPTQTGMIKTCDEFYLVEVGDVCGAIATEHGITRADFDAWNPDVKSDCTGLIAEYYVCVGVYAPPPTTTTATGSQTTTTAGAPGSTPTPVQEGMVSGCKDFYMVVSGDGCYNIAVAESITLANFYSWNPAVENDCSGLLSGFYVCVGI